MKKSRIVLSLFILFLMPQEVSAQYEILHGIFCNGAGTGTGNYIAYHSAGQTGTWSSSGSAYQLKTGFWYMAEITSTVDVAITSFVAEYTKDAIFLYWHARSDNQFDGFNIYRSDGQEEDYFRINDEPLPPGEEVSYRDASVKPGRTYTYMIAAVEDSKEFLSAELTVELPPMALTLYQNFPNPFNPITTIKYYLPENCPVLLEIFDVAGRRIARLIDETQEEGRHTFEWSGQDQNNNLVSSGTYFYRLRAGKKTISKKMILLR